MKRGEIWWADLPKPAGRRPVLLVSRHDAYRIREFIMAAPVSTRIRNITAEVRLGPEEGLPKPCAANLDSLETIPKNWLLDRISSLSSSKLLEVDEALRFSLGLEAST